MKKVKCKFMYEADMWMADREYETIKTSSRRKGEIEKEIKENIDDILLEDRRNELSKITSFYFGEDKEWQ